MKFDKELPIETKSEAWGAIFMSAILIIGATIFGRLYPNNKDVAYLVAAFVFGLAGIFAIPISVTNLRDTYFTWKMLEPYIEKYHNLELAESDEFCIDTSTFD